MDKPTVQDIFHRFYPAYLDQYSPSPVQAKVAHNIMNCKTGAYGANVCVCDGKLDKYVVESTLPSAFKNCEEVPPLFTN